MSMAASLPAFNGGSAGAAIVVMGLGGTGKTTVGSRLAAVLGATFIDAEDLHSAEALAKMTTGIALDDADRRPWLDLVGAKLVASTAHGEATVVAFSALRRAYRDRLRAVVGPTFRLLFLKAEFDEVRARVAARLGHDMPAALVASQFIALEQPEAENDVIRMPFDADLSLAFPALAARLKRSPTKSHGC